MLRSIIEREVRLVAALVLELHGHIRLRRAEASVEAHLVLVLLLSVKLVHVKASVVTVVSVWCDISNGQLSQYLIKILFVGGCVTVEIAVILFFVVVLGVSGVELSIAVLESTNILLFVELISDATKAAEAFDRRTVDIHILNFRLKNVLDLLPFCDLLLVHFLLLLVFLNTYVHIVNENVCVDVLGKGEGHGGLLIAEATGARGSHQGSWLFDYLLFGELAVNILINCGLI